MFSFFKGIEFKFVYSLWRNDCDVRQPGLKTKLTWAFIDFGAYTIQRSPHIHRSDFSCFEHYVTTCPPITVSTHLCENMVILNAIKLHDGKPTMYSWRTIIKLDSIENVSWHRLTRCILYTALRQHSRIGYVYPSFNINKHRVCQRLSKRNTTFHANSLDF